VDDNSEKLSEAEIEMLQSVPDEWGKLPYFGPGGPRWVAIALNHHGLVETDHARGCWRRTDAGRLALDGLGQ
jgi:hypothetical protein